MDGCLVQFAEKLFFFFAPLCCLCSSVKDSLTVFMFFYSIPFIYLSVLLSMPYHLDYYGFIVSISLKVKIQYQLSNFVLLQYCIGYLETFVSPYKLQNQFIDTHKMTCWVFYLDCIESALNHWTDNIQISCWWKWNICHLFLLWFIYLFHSGFCSFPHIELIHILLDLHLS